MNITFLYAWYSLRWSNLYLLGDSGLMQIRCLHFFAELLRNFIQIDRLLTEIKAVHTTPF
jgi:hypothetical protein